MAPVCQNVYIYNFSAAIGMRLKLKLNYQCYIKDNERVHLRIADEVRERFGGLNPLILHEKLTDHYDSISNCEITSQELLRISKQFLVFSYVNIIKMSNVWEAPVEKCTAQAIHLIIADWNDKRLGFCAKAVAVESPNRLTDIQVKKHFMDYMKTESKHDLYTSFSNAISEKDINYASC